MEVEFSVQRGGESLEVFPFVVANDEMLGAARAGGVGRAEVLKREEKYL